MFTIFLKDCMNFGIRGKGSLYLSIFLLMVLSGGIVYVSSWWLSPMKSFSLVLGFGQAMFMIRILAEEESSCIRSFYRGVGFSDHVLVLEKMLLIMLLEIPFLCGGLLGLFMCDGVVFEEQAKIFIAIFLYITMISSITLSICYRFNVQAGWLAGAGILMLSIYLFIKILRFFGLENLLEWNLQRESRLWLIALLFFAIMEVFAYAAARWAIRRY